MVEGLRKRPPTKNINKLINGAPGNNFVHTINRDETERYTVIFTNGAIQVFDQVDGTEKTVTTPDGVGYITTTDPRTDLTALTVADFTFVVNKSVTVDMDGETSFDPGVEAIIFVSSVNYSTEYKVIIDGTQRASYTTANSTSSSDTLKTTTVVNDLVSDLQTNLGGTWTITSRGPVIHIKKNDGSDFSVEVEDSRANTHIAAFKDRVQNFGELPTIAPRDFILEVVGEDDTNFDNYFVKFVPHNETSNFDEGVWEETVKPDIAFKFDPATMPHALVRMADGTFEFKQLEWGNRAVGDEDTNPDPTFVTRTLNDIFFHKNRLAFLSDENVIMSRAGEFFEFFRSTVTTKVDNDPIDKAGSSTKVSILKHAVPFNESILLFSDQTQFNFISSDILSQETSEIVTLTEFDSELTAPPVSSGRTVFFTTAHGAFTGVNEFFIESDTDTADAANITGHVPKYIPKGVYKMASSPNEDIMLALTDQEPNRIYVYKFLWNNREKIQSSWSFWEFSENAKIMNVDFINSACYVTVEYPDGVYLEQMNLEAGRTDTNAPFEFHLDRKITDIECNTVVYDSNTDLTTIDMPYEPDGDIQVITRHAADGETTDRAPGVVLDVDSVSANIVKVKGDVTNTRVWLGQSYEFRYRFSRQTVRQGSANAQRATPINRGRLQILNFILVYDESGFFKIEVTPKQRRTAEYKFTGRILGAESAVIGDVPIESGNFRFPVRAKSDRVDIEIVNDTFLPCNFMSAEWTGSYNPTYGGR